MECVIVAFAIDVDLSSLSLFSLSYLLVFLSLLTSQQSEHVISFLFFRGTNNDSLSPKHSLLCLFYWKLAMFCFFIFIFLRLLGLLVLLYFRVHDKMRPQRNSILFFRRVMLCNSPVFRSSFSTLLAHSLCLWFPLSTLIILSSLNQPKEITKKK